MTAEDPARAVVVGRPKRVAGLLLLAFALTAIAVGLWRESQSGDVEVPRPADAEARAVEVRRPEVGPDSAAVPPSGSEIQTDVVTVYYFHADQRCKTCLAIEERTATAVRGAFAEDMAAGRLRFATVNYEAAEGRKYCDAFDLSFGSVVVQQGGLGGPREKLDDVWKLIHGEPAAFDAYVVSHVRAFLGAAR